MELIALETGFYKGQRIRKGSAFSFDGEQVPKWAAVPGSSDEAEKLSKRPKETAADTRPKETQKAVKKKLGMLNEAA